MRNLVAGLLLFLGLVLSLAKATAQENVFVVAIRSGGYIFHSSGEPNTPLYMMMVGDVESHDQQALKDAPIYGPYAVNQTMIVRDHDDQSLWFGIEMRRPRNMVELAKLHIELSQGTRMIDTSFATRLASTTPEEILPPPFNKLGNDDLTIVKSFFVYQDGAVKILFVYGTALDQILILTNRMRDDYQIDVTINTNLE
jgi:hypothetical protein